MSIRRLLRVAVGGSDDRRTSPRICCRLPCTVRAGRERVRARVLDVSESGLCLLSPVALKPKQKVVLQIEVPPHGPLEVEAVVWHMCKVKSGTGRKAWSIGMMILQADARFQVLLPHGSGAAFADSSEAPGSPPEAASSTLDPSTATSVQPETETETDDLELDRGDDFALDTDDDLELEVDDDGTEMFRVRLKSTTGPRTRALTLSASSAVEAESLARADLDGSWMILQVSPVSSD